MPILSFFMAISLRLVPAVRVANREHHSQRSEEHTSELQSPDHLVCRLLLEKKKNDKLRQAHHRSDWPSAPINHSILLCQASTRLWRSKTGCTAVRCAPALKHDTPYFTLVH